MGVTVEIVLGERAVLPSSITGPMLTFSDLYERWYSDVVELCRRTGCGDDEPEDVAQEVFLKAWSAWGGYLQNRPVWPWLATIARRACVDHWRRQARDITRYESLAGIQDLPTTRPDEATEDAEERELVARAYARLRPGERRIIGLQVIEGWTYSDIAEFEDVTVESVRATLHRARRSLRAAYERATEGRPVAALLSGKLALSATARARRVVAFDFNHLERAGIAVLSMATIAAAVGLSEPPPALRPLHRAAPAAAGPDRSSPPAAPAPSPTLARPMVAGHSGPTSEGQPTPGTSPVSSAGGDEPAQARLPFDRGSAPEDGYFTEFTQAGQGNIVFAAGYASGGCNLPTCPALMRSNDGGVTWRRLPALGYTGGALLLPPNYPADPRLFVANPSVLQVSDDGGSTFSTLAPLGGPAAISPGFSLGDPRILIGATPGWQYRDDLGVISPNGWGTVLSTVRTFAFAPTYPSDRRVVIAGTAPTPANRNQSVVVVCTGSTCGKQAMLEGAAGPPTVVLAPSFAHTGLALAWRRNQAYRTTDGGAAFAAIRLPMDAPVETAVFDDDNTLYVGLSALGNDGTSSGGLFVSRDVGDSWQALGAGTVLARGVAAVTRLGDGRLLAAPAAVAGGGILCSADGGQSWAPRCA
jgi:RNA polymerase sigma-70 factor (ECF subfamily)